MNGVFGRGRTGARRPGVRWRAVGVVVVALAALLLAVPPPPPAAAVEPPLDTWTVVKPADGTALLGVSFVDASRGWAVGDCPRQPGATPCDGDARVLATTDGGATWVPQASGTRSLGAYAGLTDVSFTDALNGFAVGFAHSKAYSPSNVWDSASQAILATTDGGQTWRRIYNFVDPRGDPPRQLKKISCTDRLRCHAVGGARTILATSDGGASWFPQASGNGLPETNGPNGPSLFPLTGVSFTDGPGCAANGATTGFTTGCYGHAVGDDRSIIATTDGGMTWKVQVPGQTLFTGGQGFLDVWFTDHLNGWAAGSVGVLRTTDGGEHWVPTASEGGGAVSAVNHAVSFVNRLKGWAIGDDGAGSFVKVTIDGGQTWQVQYVCTGISECTVTSQDRVKDLREMVFTSDPVTGLATGYAVGALGTIVKLTSSIAPTTATLRSVSCTDATNCHAVGHQPGGGGTQPKLLATTDGGRTWEPQAPNLDFVGVSFTDGPGCPPQFPQGCYGHATDGIQVFATIDGGGKWTVQESAAAAAPRKLAGFEDLAFTDGPGCATAAAASGFTSGCYGHAVGADGKVLATSDGGRTWREQPTGILRVLVAVSFTDHLHGHALAEDGSNGDFLLRTRDGGEVWEVGAPVPVPPKPDGSPRLQLKAISFTDGPGCPPEFPRGCYGHAVGDDGAIMATTDGGTAWASQARPDGSSWAAARLKGVSFADAATGVAVGENGTILVTNDGGRTWQSRLSNTTATLWAVSVTKDAASGVATGFAVGASGTIRKVIVAPPAPTATAMSPAEGPTAGGTAVRLIGTNFTPAATVQFGSVAATPSQVSSTEITVASPPQGADSVDVTVTTAGGTAAVPGKFTYIEPTPLGGGGGGGGGGGLVGGTPEALVECPALSQPVAGQLALPAGYSLVGMPAGTVVASVGPLYGWLDQGGGGRYSVHDPNHALEAGRGYWAYFSCPRLVNLAGAGNSSASSALGAYRASMVGNPSGARPAAVSGHDFAARWDPRLNGGAGGYVLSDYRQPRVLGVGEGIWVFSYQSTTIQIAG